MNDIYSYTWKQAVEDGVLAEVLPQNWEKLTAGKPILMTVGVAGDISLAGVMEIWNEYVGWTKTKEPMLEPEDRLFETKMNGKKVWVINDAATFTVMYPEEY